jgi:hypothetical protein
MMVPLTAFTFFYEPGNTENRYGVVESTIQIRLSVRLSVCLPACPFIHSPHLIEATSTRAH